MVIIVPAHFFATGISVPRDSEKFKIFDLKFEKNTNFHALFNPLIKFS
jgi:hypothetical protein